MWRSEAIARTPHPHRHLAVVGPGVAVLAASALRLPAGDPYGPAPRRCRRCTTDAGARVTSPPRFCPAGLPPPTPAPHDADAASALARHSRSARFRLRVRVV